VTTTAEGFGAHGRNRGYSTVLHSTTEELSGRGSKQVLDVRCLDVGLDDLAAGRFGVADDCSVFGNPRRMDQTYYMPFHI
jgi:hypothetical protein